MLQRKTLLTYSQRDKAVGVRYRQGGKTDFSGKMSMNIILKTVFTFGESCFFFFIISKIILK